MYQSKHQQCRAKVTYVIPSLALLWKQIYDSTKSRVVPLSQCMKLSVSNKYDFTDLCYATFFKSRFA